MNIPFRRITKTPTEFEVSSNGVTLKGTVVFKERNIVLLQAQLQGEIELTCDICAEDFATILNEKIELLVSDGIYEGFDETLLFVATRPRSEPKRDSLNCSRLFTAEVTSATLLKKLVIPRSSGSGVIAL